MSNSEHNSFFETLILVSFFVEVCVKKEGKTFHVLKKGQLNVIELFEKEIKIYLKKYVEKKCIKKVLNIE